MDSFFSLFDPTEGTSKLGQKERKNDIEDTALKKPDVVKGRRRGRRGNVKNETLPEESSFLCEPNLDEGLVKGGGYLDSCFELTRDIKPDTEKKPKRRNSGRKSRRKKYKITPPRDVSPWHDIELGEGTAQTLETLNNQDISNDNILKTNFNKTLKYQEIIKNDVANTSFNNNYVCDEIQDGAEIQYGGRDSLNNLNLEGFDSRFRRKSCDDVSAEEKQVNNVIEQLEKVSLKDDSYTAGEFSAEDLGSDSSDDEDHAELGDSSSEFEDGNHPSLPPEPRFGNVEYKLHLVNPQEKRFQHLVTQLKWRLRSGGGCATYVVGVRDCGELRGLPPRALRSSLRTVRRMAHALRAVVAHVTARRVSPHRAVAEIYIRKLPAAAQSELRVAVVGAAGAGKSTLVGVLTQGELDNGRGSARLNMFRHVHEVRSGSTSSLSHEILGFDHKGNVVNYGCSELMTAERIGERSSKLVSFLDLAGHSKYQRTTVTGLTGYKPHYAMLLVSATAGVTRTTQEHLELIAALELPLFTVVTKCDLAPQAALPIGLDTLQNPVLIKDEEMARNCVAPKKLILDSLTTDNDDNEDSGHEEEKEDESSISPVFHVSSVTGQGLRALHAYLLALQPPAHAGEHEPCEFQIDEIFQLPARATPVVAGLLARGRLREGDRLLLGPLDTGEFVETSVQTIYRNKIPCGSVLAGQSASLGLGTRPHSLRQGMVLLARPRLYGRRPANTFSGETGPCRCLLQTPQTKRRWKERETKKERSSDIELEKDRCRCGDPLPLDDPDNPRGCFYFQATIRLLKAAAGGVAAGFTCTAHAGNVRQLAVMEGILTSTNTLRVGEEASVLFRLARRAEFLRAGRRVLCRAGGMRAAGDITQVFPA